jgi:hypothetical protein
MLAMVPLGRPNESSAKDKKMRRQTQGTQHSYQSCKYHPSGDELRVHDQILGHNLAKTSARVALLIGNEPSPWFARFLTGEDWYEITGNAHHSVAKHRVFVSANNSRIVLLISFPYRQKPRYYNDFTDIEPIVDALLP